MQTCVRQQKVWKVRQIFWWANGNKSASFTFGPCGLKQMAMMTYGYIFPVRYFVCTQIRTVVNTSSHRQTDICYWSRRLRWEAWQLHQLYVKLQQRRRVFSRDAVCSFVAFSATFAQPAFPAVKEFWASRPIPSAVWWKKMHFRMRTLFTGSFAPLGSVWREVHCLSARTNTSLLLSIMPVIIFITLNLDCNSIFSQFPI